MRTIILYWECKNCKVKGSVRTTATSPKSQYHDAEEDHNNNNEESEGCGECELELS